MRKFQQKKILELVKSLNEAVYEIRRYYSRNDLKSVMQLLADSQEVASEIVTFIENIKGEGTLTVSYFIDYYELLYQVSVEIETGNKNGDLSNRLQNHLIKIGKSVRDELKPTKYEIAFFPYKASMWDSFDSIWLAAKADSAYEVYCVPIPYYDRTSNGSLADMHYEGDNYPDYVEVTDWQSYDIQSRQPDVIFIHNPYDNHNSVTIVHPNYFAENLRTMTDCLVYVPYFAATQTSEHFIYNNGTRYAHKIIVQNEEERQRYIRFYKQAEKRNRCIDEFGKAEHKFVALGSPKFDNILNLKREDYVLPNEWRNLIQNDDGTSKKVVLYNTTVSEILQFNEQFLTKLRSVLDIFKMRDDVVLWWRPHPLSLSTFESMRPQLAKEYKAIVEQYQREGWGIFDCTGDLHRAIAMSDAYYGFGGSSLTLIYGATLKPIMASHRCDIISVTNDTCDFNEKLLHFLNCLKIYLSGKPLYTKGVKYEGTLIGLFFDDRNEYDLWNYLHYITHTQDYKHSDEWKCLVKRAYEQMGVSFGKNSGENIYKYVKKISYAAN